MSAEPAIELETLWSETTAPTTLACFYLFHIIAKYWEVAATNVHYDIVSVYNKGMNRHVECPYSFAWYSRFFPEGRTIKT